jgi:LSD1 subclass zinc finger protein
MPPDQCPREDPLRELSSDSVFEVKCDGCGQLVEFMGGEKHVRCDGCGTLVPNPKLASDAAT